MHGSARLIRLTEWIMRFSLFGFYFLFRRHLPKTELVCYDDGSASFPKHPLSLHHHRFISPRCIFSGMDPSSPLSSLCACVSSWVLISVLSSSLFLSFHSSIHIHFQMGGCHQPQFALVQLWTSKPRISAAFETAIFTQQPDTLLRSFEAPLREPMMMMMKIMMENWNENGRGSEREERTSEYKWIRERILPTSKQAVWWRWIQRWRWWWWLSSIKMMAPL